MLSGHIQFKPQFINVLSVRSWQVHFGINFTVLRRLCYWQVLYGHGDCLRKLRAPDGVM